MWVWQPHLSNWSNPCLPWMLCGWTRPFLAAQCIQIVRTWHFSYNCVALCSYGWSWLCWSPLWGHLLCRPIFQTHWQRIISMVPCNVNVGSTGGNWACVPSPCPWLLVPCTPGSLVCWVVLLTAANVSCWMVVELSVPLHYAFLLCCLRVLMYLQGRPSSFLVSLWPFLPPLFLIILPKALADGLADYWLLFPVLPLLWGSGKVVLELRGTLFPWFVPSLTWWCIGSLFLCWMVPLAVIDIDWWAYSKALVPVVPFPLSPSEVVSSAPLEVDAGSYRYCCPVLWKMLGWCPLLNGRFSRGPWLFVLLARYQPLGLLCCNLVFFS